jgi:hypothetical protein
MKDDGAWPKDKDVWRTKSGRTRIVVDVPDDGYYVMYRRLPPAPDEAITVLMPKWLEWVEREQATKVSAL